MPTEISYKLDLDTKPIANVTPEQNPMAGAPTTVRWGFMHKPNESRIKCMKLFLDRNQKLPHFVNHSNLLYLDFRTSLTSLQVSPLETATHLRRCDRTVKDAVSDFLSELYKRVYHSSRYHTRSTADSAC